MRKCLVTCWIAILFILLLSDDSISGKPRFRFGKRKTIKTMPHSSKPHSLSRKPASRKRGSSAINLGSNKPPSFLADIPDISEIMLESSQKMHDLLQRMRESSLHKPGSINVKPGSPTGPHHHPFYPWRHPVSLQNSSFINMLNVSQIQDPFQKPHEFSSEPHSLSRKPALRNHGSSAINLDSNKRPSFLADIPDISGIMIEASQRMRDLLQRMREPSLNKPGSTNVKPGSPTGPHHHPFYQWRNPVLLQNSSFINMLNVSQIQDPFQKPHEFSDKPGSAKGGSGSSIGNPRYRSAYVQDSDFFRLKLNASEIFLDDALNRKVCNFLRRLAESSSNKPGSSTGYHTDNPV